MPILNTDITIIIDIIDYIETIELTKIKSFLKFYGDELMPVLVYANFKGGVGKTTNSVMTAYQLAKNGYKTLVCDLDPQANATQLLSRTYKRQTKKDLQIDETMMVALSEQTIDKAIVKIIDNLYLLPSDDDFTEYPKFLELPLF